MEDLLKKRSGFEGLDSQELVKISASLREEKAREAQKVYGEENEALEAILGLLDPTGGLIVAKTKTDLGVALLDILTRGLAK